MRNHLGLRPLSLLTLLLGCTAGPFLRHPRPTSCDSVADGTVLPIESLHTNEDEELGLAISTHRLLVVRASCKGVALLSRCTLSGWYRYQSAQPELEVAAEAADEFEATAVPVRTRLSDAFPATTRLLRTGEAITPSERAELVGECAGATHVVRTISVRLTPATKQSDFCRSSAELPPESCGYAVTLELAALVRGAEAPLQTSGRSN